MAGNLQRDGSNARHSRRSSSVSVLPPRGRCSLHSSASAQRMLRCAFVAPERPPMAFSCEWMSESSKLGLVAYAVGIDPATPLDVRGPFRGEAGFDDARCDQMVWISVLIRVVHVQGHFYAIAQCHDRAVSSSTGVASREEHQVRFQHFVEVNVKHGCGHVHPQKPQSVGGTGFGTVGENSRSNCCAVKSPTVAWFGLPG